MLWTIKRISCFWISVILLNQSNVLFVSSTSSSSSSISSSTSTQTSSPSSLSVEEEPSNAGDTAVSASSFSVQGIKDFIYKARAVDLSRTFSSLRGSISTPFTALMYMGSLAVGAIVMLAFYESPISPLPVPPLPDPPVGRFPPEHPVWPPPSRSSQPIAHPQSHLTPNHPMIPGSLASPSDIHQIAVRPPAGYIHRRSGMENGGNQYPLKGQKQLNPLNSVASKTVSSKANKVSSTSANDEKAEFNEEANKNVASVNNKNIFPGACNGTVCEQTGTTINSTVSLLASFIKDKPQKLFDILMPRTSENNKQN